MPEYNAGEARLRIVPDASGFKRKLEADLKRIQAEYAVRVTADTTRAAQELERFRARQNADAVNLRVDVDTAAATAKIAALRTAMSGGGRGGSGLLGAAGWNLGALAVGSLPAAATAITNVAGAVQQLAQAGLAIPGIYAGIGASIGTAVIGFQGMGDAITALNEAAKSGDPKDLEKVAESLKGMAPAAVDTAKAVSAFTQGPWKELQQSVQQNMFAGVDKVITDLGAKSIPTLTKGFGSIATAWNATFKELGRVGGLDSTQGLLGRILGNTGEAQTRFTKAIEPLVHGLGTLTAAGTDVLPRLADGLGKVSERFDNFITAADEDGRLDKWIDQGLDGFTHLGETLLNIGKIFTSLTEAAGGDGGLLASLDEGTTKLANFLASAEGQEKLSSFFREGREQLRQWGPLLTNLGESLVHVFNATKTWADLLIPVLTTGLDLINSIPGGLEAMVLGFLAFKTMKPFSGLIEQLGQVNAMVGGSAGAAAGGAAAGGGAAGGSRRSRQFNNLARTFGPTLALGGLAGVAGSDTGGGQLAGALATVTGGVATGAALGGPAGALIGGTAAIAIAGLTAVLSENARAAQDAAEKQAAYEASVKAAAETASQSAAIQTDLRNALLESGGTIDANVLSSVTERLQHLPAELSNLWKLSEGDVQGVQKAIDNLNLSQGQLADQLTGSQPVFDALINKTLKQPFGDIVAQNFQLIRDSILGAQEAGAAAQPVLAGLATTLGTDIEAAAGRVKTAFADLPSDVPIKVDAPGGQAVYDLLVDMNQQVEIGNDKTIKTTAPLADEVIDALEKITGLVINNNNKTITVQLDQQKFIDSLGKLETLRDHLASLPNVNVNVPAPPRFEQNITPPAPPGGGSVTDLLLPPPRGSGGPTPTGRRGPGPTGGWIAEVHSDEWILPKHARRAVGDRALWALTEGRSFEGGGFIDEFGNPITPGMLPGPSQALGPASVAPNPYGTNGGGGINGIFGSIASGIGGPIGNLINLGSSLAGGQDTSHGGGQSAPMSLADRAASIPGLWGLVGSLNSSNPTENLANWGKNTLDWVGNFAASTFTRLGTALWKGALGLFGLENSILSPDNKWFQAGQRTAQFFLGDSGPFATLLGNGESGSGSGSTTLTAKDLREAQDKIADKDADVAQAIARLNELPADAKESTRMERQYAVDKAKREAAQARSDFSTLQQGGTATSSSRGLPAGLTPEMLPPIGSRGSEAGLQVNTLTTARAIAAAFPQIQTIGGVRKDALKWHPNGLAIDVMIPGWDTPEGKALGDRIWAFVMANADVLGVDRSASLWQVKDHFNHLHIATTGGGFPGTHDVGGRVPPGLSLVSNQTGGDEYILNRPQALEAAKALEAQRILPKPPPPSPRGGFAEVPDARLKQLPPEPAQVAPSGPPAPEAAPPAPEPHAPARPALPGPGPAPAAAGPAPSLTLQQPVAPAPSSTDHNLPAIDKGIASGAAAIGNVAATAASMAASAGGAAGPAAGAIGSLVGGLFQQGGKILQDVVNVGSSFLIGNVTGGTTPEAYGRTLRPQQNAPATAQDRNRGGRNYAFYGHDTRAVLQEMDLRESIDHQATLAHRPARVG